jgi:uncharacterized membrane protein
VAVHSPWGRSVGGQSAGGVRADVVVDDVDSMMPVAPEAALEGTFDDLTDTQTGGLDEPATGRDDLARRLVGRVRSSSPATWVVLLVAAAYTAYFTNRTLDIHHGLGTASYDSALYDQGIWLMSRFTAPFVTLMGRNLMGDHTSFVLVLMVPVYWVFPSAGALFFVQALMIAAGAVPVYLYARKQLGSDWMGAVMATVYLLHPAVSWTNMENFHPDAFLGVFVAFAIYGALERKWRLYAVFVVLSLLVKEDVSLVIVPLGVWVALKRDRRIGLLTIAGSIAFMLVAMFVVMRSLIGVPTRNGWRIPFGGPSGFVSTLVRNPTQIADHFRSEGRPWYLWQMTSPLAGMFARRPGVAAISLLVLFTNVLSTYWYQFHIQYHYSLIAVPALVMGTTYALGSLPPGGRWGRRQSLSAVAVCAVLAAYAWAPFPHTPKDPGHWPPDHPVAVAARDIIADVPAEAVVSAHYAITPHLAHRIEIYQFPNPFRVVLYGTDISQEGSRLEDRAERVELLVLKVDKSPEVGADFDVIRPAFTLVRANSSWELWRRDRSVPVPSTTPP